MPRTKVNKAAKIRETFGALGPSARPRDVIAKLAAAKIKVSSAQVSNVKATMHGHSNGHKKNGKSTKISVDDLVAVKKLVESLGSVRRAEKALAALAQLQ
jgi:hypothetical protein